MLTIPAALRRRPSGTKPVPTETGNGAAPSPEDRWAWLCQRHRTDYEAALAEALETMIYDADQDTAADRPEREIHKPKMMRR